VYPDISKCEEIEDLEEKKACLEEEKKAKEEEKKAKEEDKSKCKDITDPLKKATC